MNSATTIGPTGYAFGFALTSQRNPWASSCHAPLPLVCLLGVVIAISLCCQQYGRINDPGLLPPAKRMKLGQRAKTDAGLLSRVPNPAEPLATLCASYSAQRLLSADHVCQKGIFAFLKQTAEGFAFFDPALFCSLFGATSSIVMPSKLSLAFRVIGNAITVPQSIICLCVGLHAVLPEAIDPIAIM